MVKKIFIVISYLSDLVIYLLLKDASDSTWLITFCYLRTRDCHVESLRLALLFGVRYAPCGFYSLEAHY